MSLSEEVDHLSTLHVRAVINTADLIRHGVSFKITPTGLQWTKFSIIGHSMGESHTKQTKQNVNDAPDSHMLTPLLLNVFYCKTSLRDLMLLLLEKGAF